MLTAVRDNSRPNPFECSEKKLRHVSHIWTKQASCRPFGPRQLVASAKFAVPREALPLTALLPVLKIAPRVVQACADQLKGKLFGGVLSISSATSRQIFSPSASPWRPSCSARDSALSWA